MLLTQPLVLLLHFAQPLQLRHRRRLDPRRLSSYLAIAHLLAPTRQHEWMDVQRLRHILDQHALLGAQLHRFQLERVVVALDLLRSWRPHRPLPLGESVYKTGTTYASAFNEMLGIR